MIKGFSSLGKKLYLVNVSTRCSSLPSQIVGKKSFVSSEVFKKENLSSFQDIIV